MSLFGPEKLTLMLEKYAFKPGDSIKGTVTLNLKKPMNARKLEVGLIGRMRQSQSGVRVGSGGVKHTQSTNYTTIYNFQMPLDGEKEYQEGAYPFEIKIPSDILQDSPKLEGAAATAVNIMKALGGVTSKVEWIVVARLDLPMKLDVSKTQTIVLSPA